MTRILAIAGTLAAYVGLRGTPETINKLYALYDQVTPEDIRAAAAKPCPMRSCAR